jgi:hypothetical protein
MIAHEDVLENGGIASHILNLGTKWRWVVSFMPQLLYLRDNRHRYPMDRRLGGPQSWFERGGEKENPMISHAGNQTQVV